MPEFKSELLRLLDARGYIHQLTDAEGLDALASREIVPGYIGFDATAPSLHVGSLVQIMMLRRLQQVGHRPIVVMGGGTTKIGDPSGKDESRKLLTSDQITTNILSIRRIFERFLTFDDGPTGAIMIDNADWLDALDYISFLRDVGPHFTINRMLTFDSVRLRLEREQPLTFLEFNYMILQAYDFLELSRRSACRLQLGGSDQWGNIVNGIELTRRIDGTQLYGLTTPLITTADGGKMGKTAAGAVWLNPDLLSPYEYWQFWRNTQDADVGRFLRLFTDLPLDEIARLEVLQGAETNEAKIRLATEATAMLHGWDSARAAEATAKTTFEAGVGGTDSSFFSTIGRLRLVDAVIGLGFASSKKEARRLIQQRSIKVDGQLVTDEEYTVRDGTYAHITKGKKYHGVAHARTHESDIAHAILSIAGRKPNGLVTYEELYREIPEELDLTYFDQQPSLTRPNEPMWHQLVRNIRSHQHTQGNFVNLGLIEPIEKIGYQATVAGLQYLRSQGEGDQT